MDISAENKGAHCTLIHATKHEDQRVIDIVFNAAKIPKKFDVVPRKLLMRHTLVDTISSCISHHTNFNVVNFTLSNWCSEAERKLSKDF